MCPGDDLPDPRLDDEQASLEAGPAIVRGSIYRYEYPLVSHRGVLMGKQEGDAYPDPRRASA